MRVADFVNFIKAREAHRVAKERGWSAARRKPDPIISEYRFCNVRRNDDRVTKYVMSRVVEPWADHPELWFAIMVARLFNNEQTLEEILQFTLPFKPERMRKALHMRRDRNLRCFNAAYIVSTAGAKMDKIDYVIDRILCPAWAERKKISRDIDVGQLGNVHLRLMQINGLASFMAAQVVADLKYANPDKWEDFHTFVASGPGSKRGLNRVMGKPIELPYGEAQFRSDLLQLRDAANARLPWEPLTAQDIQNCLCEFDKYERARTREGRPKQKYTPAELPWKED
jgi:hypothetical protein